MWIILVRHGKTQGNLEGRYVGQTDEPLLIEEEERLLQSGYRRFYPDVVYTSELLRCRQTADILFGPERSRQVVCPGLNETDFGDFEYRNYEELNGDPAYQAWIDSGGMLAFPGGESGADFRKRCQKAFLDCLADAKSRKAQCVAFVIHGGTIMSIMGAFGFPSRDFYSWQVKNGAGFLTRLRESEEGNIYLDVDDSNESDTMG